MIAASHSDALADTSEEGRLAAAIACMVAAAAAYPERRPELYLEAVALIRAYGDKRAARATQ